MPNTRRRRFSVQNEISGRQPTKNRTDQSSGTDFNSDFKMTVNNVRTKPKSKKKPVSNNTFKNVSSLEVVTECDSNTSLTNILTSIENIDIQITSSNIEIENTLSPAHEIAGKQSQETVNQPVDLEINKDPRQFSKERTSLRRDRHPRQHRIKVRSPKRKLPMLDQNKPDVPNYLDDKQTIGSDAINWEEEFETCIDTTCLVQSAENEERQSTHSTDDMCRICHGGDSLTSELGCLISACSCRGTVGRVHVKCLERWLTESGKSRCELCGIRYETRRVHRYGVLKALVMWILSQNAKQLMVDSLGIMLMSPLAVLAAWLSGRTLAGLMTHDSHITPWPLASTFVLACMTLVCYYCWIVSAATRHALGWWIWYRSQYEVRLEIQENEEYN